MHRFLRAIGFSQIKKRKQIQELLFYSIQNAEEKSYTSGEEDTMYAQYQKSFGENFGITIFGEFDESNHFTMDYYYPYAKGVCISSYEDISVERHADKESYAGICDDVKVGVSLIFYLQNVISYLKLKNADRLPVRGTSLVLSALSDQGSIMLPIKKNESDKKKTTNQTIARNRLIAAARQGDEDAIESLTLEDMDTYTTISRRILKEDIFTLVDTCFMPYGVECDQYSIVGEIVDYHLSKNQLSKEEVYQLTINCNDLIFEVYINRMDLLGEPDIGRRFKGYIWMQGHINFPD